MAANVAKIAEEIVGLTLMEATELTNILKDEYGIEAAAGAVAVAAHQVPQTTLVAQKQKRIRHRS